MTNKSIHKPVRVILTGIITAMMLVPMVHASDLTVSKTWVDGETLTAADLNDSFDEVEAAVTDNDTRVTGLESDVGSNDTRITNLENDVSDNTSRLDNIESQKYLTLNPYGALLGGGATVHSGFGRHSGIRFPDSGTSSFGLGFVLPPDYQPGDAITVNLIWHTSSVSCGIDFRPNSIAVARAGQTHIMGAGASTGLSSIGGNILAAPTVANQSGLKQLSIVAPDGSALNPGDSVIFNMFRSSGSANDTCTGDLTVQGISIEY